MEAKKKGRSKDKFKNKDKDKDTETLDDESSQNEVENFNAVEETDQQTFQKQINNTGGMMNENNIKTPQESSVPQTPKEKDTSITRISKEASLPQTPKGAETPASQTSKKTESPTLTPKGTETPVPHTPKQTETSVPQTPKGTETPVSQTFKGFDTAASQIPKEIETAASQIHKEIETAASQLPKDIETVASQIPKETETSFLGVPKQPQSNVFPLQKDKVSTGSVGSKGKKISGEIEAVPESFEGKVTDNSKITPAVVSFGGGAHPAAEEIKPCEGAHTDRFNIFSATLPGFSCSPNLLQKRSPFIHNPPQPEERRERIPCPRTPREYIINLRENLADFQESHGLPRTRDYSFCSLGLALAQETGRAIFSLFHMFTELFPILAIVSLILRFALDKLIEILETNETGNKIKKSLIFALEMIAIVIPLWILIGTIILPLFGLVLTILKNMLRIKGSSGKKKTVVVQQKPKVQIKASTSYK